MACYVKFRVSPSGDFDRLVNAVMTLKKHQATEAVSCDDQCWRGLFTEEQLKAFWWPSADERERWTRFWFSTPLPERHSPEMPQPPWDLASMIDAILQAEYVLIGVKEEGSSEGILEFEPVAYPFGSTRALRALIRAFGFQVLGADDGTGYVAGDSEPPLWTAE